MGTATTLSTPQDQVEALIQQVAAENDLNITDQLQDLNPTASTIGAASSASADHKKEDDLSRRLDCTSVTVYTFNPYAAGAYFGQYKTM